MKHLISSYSARTLPVPVGVRVITVRMHQLDRAAHIKKTLGVKVAARYMAKRNWSLEASLWWLLGKESRDHRLGA